MIDYHCHLLPGLDDGPESWDEALAMARALAAFGFREICCTPHCIKGQYEISPVEVRDTVRRLQARLDGEGIGLTLRPGMEYYLDEYFERFAANLLPLGDSRLVLCEAPPQALPELVAAMAGLIVVQGYTPLIAHPERSEPVLRLLENRSEERGPRNEVNPDPRTSIPEPRSWFSRLFKPRSPSPDPRAPSSETAELPESCLYQANLGSFAGFYGPKPQRRAYELLQRGVYACFASDLHDPRSTDFLDAAREKIATNPALQKLAAFQAPQGGGGSDQLAFW